MFIAALFTITKRWKQSVSISRGMDKQNVVYPYNGILYFKKKSSIYLLLAVLGLRCCTQAFYSCSERELLFVAVCGLLIAVTSPVAEHGL